MCSPVNIFKGEESHSFYWALKWIWNPKAKSWKPGGEIES